MILEGIVALSTGENPRLIEEKLVSFLPNLQKLQKNKDSAPGREVVRTGIRPPEAHADGGESKS
jgi:flagellar motor component MotA